MVMEAHLNTRQQVKNALGDIRAELWAIEVGIVAPKNKVEAVAFLRDREMKAAAYLGV